MEKAEILTLIAKMRQRSSTVEQHFCKVTVGGSIPLAGSRELCRVGGVDNHS